MKEAEAKHYLKKLLYGFRLIRLTEILLTAAGVGFIIVAVSGWVFESQLLRFIVGGGSAVLTVLLKVYRSGILTLDELSIAFYLNGKFPGLRESADLILSDRLSSLQSLQKQKILVTLSDIRKEVRLPNHIALALVVLLTGIIAYRYLPVRSFMETQQITTNGTNQTAAAVEEELAAGIVSISIGINPPAYTGIGKRTIASGSTKLPENSAVEWTVQFTKTVLEPKLIFSANDSLLLSQVTEGVFRATRKITDHSLYQVKWKDGRGLHRSDFYYIAVVKDLPPKLEVSNLQQFTELNMDEHPAVVFTVRMLDDYGLKNAFITATVSKGSGEGIKFREEKLSFSKPARISGKDLIASRSIDLRGLGLEPGDELYFYVEAHDNKEPVFNQSRTETFFISLRDTAKEVTLADAGLGVDLMPDYFRSQRQIIIDSEKLLAEQKKIKRNEFNSRSNELGFDQKSLRLKYGQFLGDEEETGIQEDAIARAEETKTEEEKAEEEKDPLKKFGHEHDTKNEHNLVAEKKADDHAHTNTDEENEDPLKTFRHEHDNQDEAAFFVQTVKTKLKLALSLMWDAELHLRMFDPKKSLPYQYRILNLLKEISQDSRVYVHRTGFDPPPIKEEKRLTADLDEIVNSTARAEAVAEKFTAIRTALVETEKLIQYPGSVDDNSRMIFETAGYELAGEALKNPGMYLESLSLIKKLSENDIPSEEVRNALIKVRRDLWTILPSGNGSPGQKSQSLHKLDQQLVDNFDKAKRE